MGIVLVFLVIFLTAPTGSVRFANTEDLAVSFLSDPRFERGKTRVDLIAPSLTDAPYTHISNRESVRFIHLHFTFFPTLAGFFVF